VSHVNRREVSAIDTATHTIVATVPVPFNPRPLAVTPDGAFVYVGGLNGMVWVIETATNTLVATVPLSINSVEGLAVTPDGLRAYAVHSTQISAIDTGTNTIVATVQLGPGVHGAVAFTAGSCVRGYVAHNIGAVQVVKPTPVDFVMGSVPVGPVPAGVAVSPPAPNTGIWTVVQPMPTARSEMAAATGPDGKIYAIGGRNAQNTPLDTVEAYDPLTDTWTTVAPVQFECQGGATRRSGHAAAMAADGRIYAIGGFCAFPFPPSMANGTPTVEAYDPSADTWTFVEPIPSFGVGRYLLAAATGLDGRIYGIGGAVRDAVGFELAYSSVAAYDSSIDTWNSVSPLSTPRFDLAGATAPDGKVYAIAGLSWTPAGPISYKALDLMDGYDPSTDSWTAGSCLPMSLRSGLAAATGPDGRIYAIGGSDHNGNVVNTVEAYLP
jgi:N-acetylneuraminic acid mutarotase